jgi:hypothetical protein
MLLLQILRQERRRKFPSLFRVVGAVALLVIWILEGVSGVRKYVDFGGFPQRLQI